MLPAGLRQPPKGLQEPCFSLTPCQAVSETAQSCDNAAQGKGGLENRALREAPPPSDHHRTLWGHSCQCFVRLELRGQPENPLLTCFCSPLAHVSAHQPAGMQAPHRDTTRTLARHRKTQIYHILAASCPRTHLAVAPCEAPGVDAVPSELKAGFALYTFEMAWFGGCSEICGGIHVSNHATETQMEKISDEKKS